MKYYSYYESKIGILEFYYENNILLSLKIVSKILNPNIKNKFTDDIYLQINEYLEGKRKSFNINYTLNGTEFQKKVWKELNNIGYGKFLTYKEIAMNIGNPKATRAVGNALNKNPIPIIIPCHRVVGSNGTLTGFAYGVGLKKLLLDLEKSY